MTAAGNCELSLPTASLLGGEGLSLAAYDPLGFSLLDPALPGGLLAGMQGQYAMVGGGHQSGGLGLLHMPGGGVSLLQLPGAKPLAFEAPLPSFVVGKAEPHAGPDSPPFLLDAGGLPAQHPAFFPQYQRLLIAQQQQAEQAQRDQHGLGQHRPQLVLLPNGDLGLSAGLHPYSHLQHQLSGQLARPLISLPPQGLFAAEGQRSTGSFPAGDDALPGAAAAEAEAEAAEAAAAAVKATARGAMALLEQLQARGHHDEAAAAEGEAEGAGMAPELGPILPVVGNAPAAGRRAGAPIGRRRTRSMPQQEAGEDDDADFEAEEEEEEESSDESEGGRGKRKRRRAAPAGQGARRSRARKADAADGEGEDKKARSSKFRGVTKHRRSGRYEAHIWVKEMGRQVYLGGYEQEEHAAEAYDIAAIKCKGRKVKSNFAIDKYEDLMSCIGRMSMEELVMAVRRQSQGFSRGSSSYRGVTHHPSGRFESRIGVPGSKHVYLGLFAEEEAAAKAYDRALVRLRGPGGATNFPMGDYKAEMSEYHAMQSGLLREDARYTEIQNTYALLEKWVKSGLEAFDDLGESAAGQEQQQQQE